MQTDSLYDDLKKRHNNYMFDAILVGWSGGGGGSPPPFAITFITGSERVHMGSVSAGAKILEATLRKAFGICRLLT